MRSGLLSLSLLTCLTLSGCGSTTQLLRAPTGAAEAFLTTTPEPELPAPPVTNGVLTGFIRSLQDALRSANADKASALRALKE